ncbi:MAG TPA: hypothetical protein VJG49_01485 [Candidatus Nanoarchaeia archaeon]|nr:hypothetical protein [Candidatus Nanoarchaeia archaeon]
MDKKKILEYVKKVEYHLDYFWTNFDEARIVEARQYLDESQRKPTTTGQ